MEQYISKSAVVAEIERLDELNIFLSPTEKYNEDYKCGYENALEEVRDFVDTLEVKEVDFEKEWKEFLKDGDVGFKEIAKHFFELGLKAQKL